MATKADLLPIQTSATDVAVAALKRAAEAIADDATTLVVNGWLDTANRAIATVERMAKSA